MMLQARELRVSLSSRPVLHGVDLGLEAGELVSIIGPNGSGKTTMLRALTGEIPYQGRIEFSGLELKAWNPAELASLRGVLSQATPLAFPFTVREVVKLGLTGNALSLANGSAGNLLRRALEQVDLGGYAGRFYQELSGGEQQRVQLARVLCQVSQPVVEGVPRCLFLDEPVASLDIYHQLMIMDVARGFADQGGAVLSVMHDLNLAAMYSDRIFVMCEGLCAGSGSVKDVLTDDLLYQVFGCKLRVGFAPTHQPFVLPQSTQGR